MILLVLPVLLCVVATGYATLSPAELRVVVKFCPGLEEMRLIDCIILQGIEVLYPHLQRPISLQDARLLGIALYHDHCSHVSYNESDGHWLNFKKCVLRVTMDALVQSEHKNATSTK